MKPKQLLKTIGYVLVISVSLLQTPLKGQNVGINTTGTPPNAKAMLDIDVSAVGTKMGLLVPRMTTVERNGITAPIPESLLIYNTTTQCFEGWNQAAGVWVPFGCIGCTTPSSPSANAATNASNTAFTANWTFVSGATAYLLDVSTSATFASFVGVYNGLNTGNVISNNVTGLTCGTTYYYRIRATNACGTSVSSNTITVIPTCSGGSCGTQIWAAANLDVGIMINGTVTATNNGIVEKYCYNDLPANCANYGGLYRWDEMMNYTSTINCDPCGGAGRQGICPAGFHIPTDLEWSRFEFCLESNIAPIGATTLLDFQTISPTRGNTFAGVGPGSKMKTAAGSPWADGAFSTNTSGFSALPGGNYGGFIGSTVFWSGINTFAIYWSATEMPGLPTNAWFRSLASGVAEVQQRAAQQKIYGASVRCLQN